MSQIVVKLENVTYEDLQVDGDDYYKEFVGVTVSNSKAQRIEFKIDNKNAPFVITKPFHTSQRIIKKTDDGVIFNIFVQINFELERLILGFGDRIEVIKPLSLRNRMLKELKNSVQHYEDTSK
ncbi:helix-turn-helix transcriptional regulator [Winogradskyella schleiferi]|uniref:helix-turn-helix transcriptional regulator n=1 Tax=Winogradskyella schleiferi TaxID=2686078 RepID=UPI0015B9EF35